MTLVLARFALWVGIGVGWGILEFIGGRNERLLRHGRDRPRDVIAFFSFRPYLDATFSSE